MSEFNPGRLPSIFVPLRPEHSITLPANLMSALDITPQGYVRETLVKGKSVIFEKYEGEVSPRRPEKDGMESIIRVSQQGRVKIPTRFCRRLELEAGENLILYLDEAHRHLILQKYDLVDDSVEQIRAVRRTIQRNAAEASLPSANYYAAMQSLVEAEQLLLAIKHNARAKQKPAV